jgi:hypothetical protein
MPSESEFVQIALTAANSVLKPPLFIKRGAALFYEITVDNRLELTIEPKRPMRGSSAFQTDLCVFESKSKDVEIPRVVLEFKEGVSTHDVITYSVKARKHKQVYPYLRYGLIVSKEASVPKRFFTHNESLDFFGALSDVSEVELSEFFRKLIAAEVETSKRLEKIFFEGFKPILFRSEVVVDWD